MQIDPRRRMMMHPHMLAHLRKRMQMHPSSWMQIQSPSRVLMHLRSPLEMYRRSRVQI